MENCDLKPMENCDTKPMENCDLKPINLLVTGGCGFIGSNFINRC